jgi:hypothetical protein
VEQRTGGAPSPADCACDRREDAAHGDSRREERAQHGEADQDDGGADGSGAGAQWQRHRGAEEPAGVPQPVDGCFDRRATAAQVEQPDRGEHHEHEAETDSQWRRCARLLIVLVLLFLTFDVAAGASQRPAAGEQQRGEAEASGGQREPASSEQGGAGVGEELTDRPRELGSEAEQREHAEDDEPDGEGIGAVALKLKAGGLARPLPDRGARRGAPRRAAAAACGRGLATAGAGRCSHGHRQ